MAKQKIFAIKDEKAGFVTPYTEINELVAIRNFSETCRNPETPLAKYPEDYSLYLIGEFDTETGQITGGKNLIELAKAITYAERKKSE